MQKQNKLNKKNGIQMEFYGSGELKRDYYLVNNKMHGNDTWRYENGQIDYVCPYVNNEKHGKCFGYYENGKVMAEYNYVNDEKHGVEKWFYETGQLSSLTTYEHGIKHGEKMDYHLEKTGEYFLLSKFNHEHNNYLVPVSRSNYEYIKMEKGNLFMCENKYYKITRGTLTRSSFGDVRKSNNLKVVLMKWQLQHSVIVPSDGHSKKVHHIDRFELVEDGESMKLMTFNKNISLTPFLEASLAIEWKTETERAKKLSKVTNMLSN